MKTIRLALLLALSAGALPARAQETPDELDAPGPSFDTTASSLREQLETSLTELSALREQIAADQIPLSRRLTALQGELVSVRAEYGEATRVLNSRSLDVSNLSKEIKRREDEAVYLSGLYGDYIRNFESRLHIAELQRYQQDLEAARLAPENSNLSGQEVFQIQAGMLALSLDRLEDALGGTRFEGRAVDSTGLLRKGTFALIGPAGLFLPEGGDAAGSAEQRLGSLEPALIEYATLEDGQAAAQLVASGSGLLPLDATLGNAHKIEATRETLLDEFHKGGVVMYPIFALAGLALLVALYKWLSMAFIRKPSSRKVGALLEAVGERDVEAAQASAAAIEGPVGRMLAAGVEHLRQPRELIEEVMYEIVLTTRLKLQGLLPFIAICAASAPLLGLLGTVTGIIKTFKQITLFGSGDVKSLSGGISEALITTKFGLIVAIPSLLVHAFLSRRARGVVDQMEKSALALINEVSKSPEPTEVVVRGALQPPGAQPANGVPDPDLVRLQVREILDDLLVPFAQDDLEAEPPRKAAARVDGGRS